MSQTPEERVAYWKKRVMDRVNSLMGQMDIDFQDIWDNINHVNLDSEKMRTAAQKIEDGFKEFIVALQDAKVRVEKPPITPIKVAEMPKVPSERIPEDTVVTPATLEIKS